MHLCAAGNLKTRYDTAAPQISGMGVQVERPRETTITALRQDSAASIDDYPRGYQVELSADGKARR